MQENNLSKMNLTWITLLLPSLLIVLALWLPFGFKLMGLIEEWGFLQLYIQHGLFFIQSFHGPSLNLLRPLLALPFSLAYFLDPNSFDYWNILLILSLIITSVSSAYLILKATGSRSWAVLMGMLVILYPAETMQLSLRSLHIEWALALVLLASAFFIAAYENKRTYIAYSLALVASLLLLVAIGIYEASLALIFLPFSILYIKDGFNITTQQLKSHFGIVLLWMAAIGCFIGYLSYAVFISPNIIAYQKQLSGGTGLFTMLLASLPKLFSIGLVRSLLGGWFDAIRMTLKEFAWLGYLYLTIGATIIGGLFLFIVKKDAYAFATFSSKSSTFRCALRLSIAGVLLLCCGYAPTLASNHTYISQRTFVFATPGAAMVWIACIIIIGSWRQWIAKFLACVLIFIGLGAQLFQFHHYVQLSDIQRHLLKNIIENFNGDLNNKTLLILDASNQLGQTWMLLPGGLEYALSYFYNKPINVIRICSLPSHEWRVYDGLARMGTCIENKNNWVFRYPLPTSGPGYVSPKKQTDIILTKNQSVVITIKPDGSISPNAVLENYRNQLQQSNSPMAKRYRNILVPKPNHFNSKQFWANHDEQYKWNFGDWWSLDLPTKGSGWREGEWQVNYFYHKASAWKTQKKATLLFNLKPIQKPYLLRGNFDTILNQVIHDSIQIRINQKLLSLHWINYGKFNTTIPANVLLNGINTIEFISDTDPKYFDLSLKLESIEIIPNKALAKD
ncbi:hypothetical protein BH10PSE19_BH10PSE19_03730 [soil metagenome]